MQADASDREQLELKRSRKVLTLTMSNLFRAIQLVESACSGGRESMHLVSRLPSPCHR
jgi:hypothetical protein